MFTIIRDTREKEGKGYWFDKVEKKCGKKFTVECVGTINKKLDFADYSIEGLEQYIAIERKGSASELYNNFGTKANRDRFMREIEGMQNIKYKYLVLECSLDEILSGSYFSRVHPSNVLSQLQHLEMKNNFHIVYAGNAKAAKKIVYNILRKAHQYYGESSAK